MTNTKPTTIRLPDEVLNELDRRARARGKDRATLLRELLQDALQRDTEDEVVASYRAGRLSLSQAASRLGTDAWSLFDILGRRGGDVERVAGGLDGLRIVTIGVSLTA